MDKYNMSLDVTYWECGDGCCDGGNTMVTVNGIEIGSYSDLSNENLNGLKRFMSLLNESDEDLSLSFSVSVDADGDLRDTILLKGIQFTDSIWSCHVYRDILLGLKLPFESSVYEVDWDTWQKEERLVLVLQEEEEEELQENR